MSSSLGDILREKVFQTADVEDPEADLSNVSIYGVECKNISQEWIPSAQGDLGAWFMKPQGDSAPTKAILYVHGVKCNRSRTYRVGLYNVLLKLGYSVLAFDYRGFGDSAHCSLDESSVVQDAILAFEWLRQKVGHEVDIIVFGHSMGAAIASHAVSKMKEADVKALILMSPFNNFTDQMIAMTSRSWILSSLTTLTGGYFISGLLRMLNMQFNQDQHLQSVMCPILILHAEDDDKIPVTLARKLAETVSKHNSKVQLQIYPEALQYGHHDIYKDENLPKLLTDFLNF